MSLLLNANLENIVKNDEYKNPKTGEVSSASITLQTRIKTYKDNGTFKYENIDIYLPFTLLDEYIEEVGEEVSIPVKAYATKQGKVGYSYNG